MNPLLQVKLTLRSEKNSSKPKGRTLSANAVTTVDKISSLINDLKGILIYYQSSNKYIDGILIDANYNTIIAKSKRIQALLKPHRKSVNEAIVGARFSDAPEGEENHIITYYVTKETIERTIAELEICSLFLHEILNGEANSTNFNNLKDKNIYTPYKLSESKIRNIIVDCSVLDSFSVPSAYSDIDKNNILITFFKTELSISELLSKLNIDRIQYQYSIHGENTISVSKNLFEIIRNKVPYMISMISNDLSKITVDEIVKEKSNISITIPSPNNEPTIGVIDTLFDETAYFSEWVENHDYLDELEKSLLHDNLREHGTEVSSIIVDGPRLNPWLDDGCGRFKVRHFGVCEDRISTLRLVKKIEDIILHNPDIHVWNLSLGTEDEVSKNFISFDASVLDSLQAKYNIVFVVAGTNDNRNDRTNYLKIGSPADSLNSIVVNSVRRDGKPASYSRKGTVLSFFNKPDIAYYGGDFDDRIKVFCPSKGETMVYGTSFAAPWISRKLCYLIDIMGIPREIAKALIIDSSAGWEYKINTYKQKDLLGYGIVPIDIQKIIASESDEIKFFVYGTSQSYKTANYGIPIPKDSDNKYPYIARATLCYFPECSRSQGIDYTNRELSLKFGRITNKGKIDDINDNIQDDDFAYIDERRSRNEFRKWENTKFISKVLKNKLHPIKAYDDRLWGISIISKERLTSRTETGLNFGAVITLKEINGNNRIQDFIQLCSLRGWIVNEINVQNRVDIYNKSQEEIFFE